MCAIGFRRFRRNLEAVGFLVLACSVPLPLPAAAAEPAPAAKTPAAPETPKLTVSGKVVDKDGHPVANAKVLLREWSTYRQNEDPFAPVEDILATTSTDKEGQFSFANVASKPFKRDWPEQAPWDVVVQANGLALAWHHLTASSEPSPVTITLMPEAKIAGQIVDSQGKPVAGARVTVDEVAPLGSQLRSDTAQSDRLDLALSRVIPAVQSDAQGGFQIAGLPPSMRIALGVQHDDFVRQTVFAATTDQPQPDLVARFYTGDQEQSMSFPVQIGKVAVKLQPGCRLGGRITYADSGKPAAQAIVVTTSPSWHSAKADAEGRFAVPGLAAAQYAILVYPPAEASYLVRQLVVTIGPDERTKDLTTKLEPGQVVTGKVVADDTHAGVQGVQVLYRPAVLPNSPDRSLARAGVTDSQGAFRLVVPSGKADVILSGPVSQYYVPIWQFSQAEPDPRFVRSIDVAPGKSPEAVELTITRGLIIGGVVTDSQGQPVAGAEVFPVRNETEVPPPPSTQTDREGRFVLSGLPPSEPQQLLAVHPDKKLIASTQIEAGEKAPTRTVSVNIRLQPASSAAGLVLVSGKPQAGMQVTLLAFRTEKEQRYASKIDFAVTDEKGQYQFDLLEPGEEYAVAFQESGYTQEQSATFKPKPGERAEVTPLELLRADRSVAGVVVDPEGKPVEGAVVAASRRNGRAIGGAFTREPTDKEGRFRIEGVPNVPLSLTVYLPPPPGSSARKTVVSAPVNTDPDKTDVRIVFDPSQAKDAKK